jgi:hypothetical protein
MIKQASKSAKNNFNKLSSTNSNKLNSYRKLIARVFQWGADIFGFKSPSITASGRTEFLLDLIWEPILNSPTPQQIRSRLSDWKVIRNWFMKLLGGSEEERKVLLSNPPKGSTPTLQAFAKEWMGNLSTAERRSWTTVLFSTRILRLPSEYDDSTIVKAGKIPTPNIAEYVIDFWKELRFTCNGRVPKGARWTSWHLTSKQGPNGFALHTLWQDFVTLDEKVRYHLGNLGGDSFKECLSTLDKLDPHVKLSRIPTTPGILRRVAYFSDLEGKTRVVALLDYFSQTVLKPLHHYLFKVLKRIPQDFTFDQGGFKNHINEWDHFYSCDLTAATDRFPIKVISSVLQGIFPESYVTSWEYIMIGLPYDSPKGSINYAVGNPMGAYSSWSSFTVAHHYVMYYCCRKLGLKWRTAKYAILGDDVLIGDTALYREYRRVLTILGVPVSEAKTHESKILCEFAKRWIHQGEEITPFPIPAMVEARNYAFLATLLKAESIRGYKCDIPSSVRLWFEQPYKTGMRRCKKPRKKFFADLYLKSYIAEQLINVSRKEITWVELFHLIYLRVHGRDPLPYMDDIWIRTFWVEYFRNMWTRHLDSEDDDEFNENDQFDPLEEIQSVVHEFMSSSPDGEGLVDFKQIPWLEIADQIQVRNDDEFDRVISKLVTNNLNEIEAWDTIRGFILPDLATTFRGRKYDVVRVLAGRLASDVLSLFRRGERIKVTFTRTLEGGVQVLDLEAPEIVIDIFNPLMGMKSWEGEPH